MKNRNLILMFAVLCSIIGCTAEGLTGPEGPVGPIGANGAAGARGDAGAIGAAGKDGSVIYSGNGVPAPAAGNTGDYYLDRSTANLYGPKLATGWGTPVLLMGAQGATGATGANGTNGADGINGTNGADGTNGTNGANGGNGSTTLSGTVAPSVALGNPGDYYLDKSSYLLYGPKDANGWGIPILLRGAAGAQGPTGAAGKDGSIIYSGSGAPVSTIGINGDYYLDKNTGNLYGPKIGANWGTALLLKGTNGINGTNGTDGTDGVNGMNGANGANGTNGINGSTTLSGNGAPGVGLGALGDYYLDKTNYLLYGPKVAGSWGIPILLRGAAGPQGPTGPAGVGGTVIYSGETAPDPALGKIGDFYFGRLITTMFGPKSALGWGFGVNLKGADGAAGTNGTNGTNGTAILNGVGLPANTLGKNGDFYIDISSYVMYGPKIAGAWSPYGTSLRGQNGADGNANVIALETPDNVTFSWSYESSNRMLKKQGVSANDTSSVFNIPAANFNAVKSGVVLVYIRADAGTGSYIWKQLNFTDINLGATAFYKYLLRVNPADAKIRILHNVLPDYTPLAVDKVRIIITPASSTGVLSAIRSKDEPMTGTMQKLGLSENDFISLK
jgi:hypothetical protein